MELDRLIMNEAEAEALTYEWLFWSRPKQQPPPGNWRIWLLLAGRGFGKTRTITEWGRDQAERHPGSRGAIVAATAADARDILVEGESGILAVSPPWFFPRYEPSKRRLTWPNGTVATIFSADEPDRLRGPQHHWAVADELAAWRYAAAWDMLLMGMRLGDDPRVAVATTPRPTPLIKDLLADHTVAVTRGTTYENQSNLAAAFFRQIIRRYEGTRLGHQELNAELLLDVPGALWTRQTLEETRVPKHPSLVRIVVAIDPAATSTEQANDTGIVVAGVDENDHGYVLADLSLHGPPAQWGAAAVRAYDRWEADGIIGETNNGGEMVGFVVKTAARMLWERGDRDSPTVPYRQVRASRNKQTRAEPIATEFEAHHAHMVGSLAKLEDQLCTWLPGEESPDRLDAMVWALSALLQNKPKRLTSSDGQPPAAPPPEPARSREEIERLLSG